MLPPFLLVALRADGTIGDTAFQRVEQQLDSRFLPSTDASTRRSGSSLLERSPSTNAPRGLDADAWMIGRISMDAYAGKARLLAQRVRSRIPRTDFFAKSNARSYAMGLDPSCDLRWSESTEAGLVRPPDAALESSIFVARTALHHGHRRSCCGTAPGPRNISSML